MAVLTDFGKKKTNELNEMNCLIASRCKTIGWKEYQYQPKWLLEKSGLLVSKIHGRELFKLIFICKSLLKEDIK